MAKRLNVPDDLQGSFQKMMQLIPEILQNDIDTQNIILVYLKAGGEKMARHGIEIIKMRFLEEIQQENEELSTLDSIDSDIGLFRDQNADDDDLDDDHPDDDEDDDLNDGDLDDY